MKALVLFLLKFNKPLTDILSMSQITRPLLAVALEDLTTLDFSKPIIASPKLDGIRVLKVGGQVLTRKFKPLPNVYVREQLEAILPDGIDGEIMLYGTDNFNTIQSQVMSFDGEPDFYYNAFDYVKDSLDKPYIDRLKDLEAWHNPLSEDIKRKVKVLEQNLLTSLEQLVQFEERCVAGGFEGVMIRSIDGKYKCNRSTLKEGILLKLKRFDDSEAEVLGLIERLHNENEKEKNELGLSKRSTKKEGMVAAGTLGAFAVRDVKSGIEFEIGTGLTDEQRLEIWTNQGNYIGKLVKYKFQGITKEKPRFPVFLGFRSELDL